MCGRMQYIFSSNDTGGTAGKRGESREDPRNMVRPPAPAYTGGSNYGRSHLIP